MKELQEIAPVVWLRCYTSGDNFTAGERLVAEFASSLPFSVACTNEKSCAGTVGEQNFNDLWVGAREVFLAPWIFGLSNHEEPVLKAAERNQRHFWAFTEYGRGMGNIHTYTKGFGSKVPTGWTVQGEPGGVFRSILRAPRSSTDWRQIFAGRCGLADGSQVRLWWFYSRKDDEKKHDFSVLDENSGTSLLNVAKVVPVSSDDKPLTDPDEKTVGEKLADQLFQAASDPDFQPTTDVSCAEATAGCAGQLSQFLWSVVFDEGYTSVDQRGLSGSAVIDIVVAPNIFTRRRELHGEFAAAEVTRFDLLRGPLRKTKPLPNCRRLFVCSAKVPRDEMRSFLEQCEQMVFTTGDQSLAEAIFMGKIPCIKPDAKVQQWKLALVAKAYGTLDAVPDLGKVMRALVEDPAAREEARKQSRVLSDAIERRVASELGGPPSLWPQQHHILVRAGMLG